VGEDEIVKKAGIFLKLFVILALFTNKIKDNGST